MEEGFFTFTGGTRVPRRVAPCRGCWMTANWNQLPDLLRPVWEDDDLFLVQDAAIPLPGMYVLSTQRHVTSIDQLDSGVYTSLMKQLRRVRRVLRTVIPMSRVLILQEEILNGNAHVHFCLIPLPEGFRTFSDNLGEYVQHQADNEQSRTAIVHYNALLRDALCRDEVKGSA